MAIPTVEIDFIKAHGPRDSYEYAELARVERLEKEQDIARNPALFAEREKQERKRQQRDDDDGADMAYAVLELDQQLAELNMQIDRDMSRLTELMIENERELTEARDDFDLVQQQAVTLRDGRRAYLHTETQKFVDAHGQALTDDDLIDAQFPENGT